MKDDIIDYPGPENSGYAWKDAIFNWTVRRYKKHNHPWHKSDQRIWHGAIFGLTQYFGSIFFFVFIGLILYQTQKLFGFARAVLLALLMILFRINIIIKQIVQLNRKF
jgi:hypothetical protein